MKKVLLGLVTLTVVMASIFAFAACGPFVDEEIDMPDSTGYGEAAPQSSVIGSNVVTIDDAMKNDGKKMFLNAVNNFEKCDYATAWLVGQVDTKVMSGTIQVKQMVDALRVRDHGNQYMYNNSFTIGRAKMVDIRIMDNYYYDKATGKTYLLATNGKKNIDIINKVEAKAKAWDPEREFPNKEEFMAVTKNDPTVLNMYDLSNETVTTVAKPELKTTQSGAKYYEFSEIVCDANKAFIPYLPVMKYMLDQQMEGATIKDTGKILVFKNVQIWENGVFKQYDVEEGYSMNAMGIINGDIMLKSTVKFNYDNKKQPITQYYNNGFTAKNIEK